MDRECSVMDGYRGFLCCIITAWLGVAEHSCHLPGLSSLSQVWISPIGGYWASGGYQAALFGTHLVCFVVLPKVKVLSCVPKPCVIECPLRTEAAFCKLPGVCPTVTGFYQEHPELSGQFSQLGFGSWCWAKRCLEEHPGNVLAVNRAECIRA